MPQSSHSEYLEPAVPESPQTFYLGDPTGHDFGPWIVDSEMEVEGQDIYQEYLRDGYLRKEREGSRNCRGELKPNAGLTTASSEPRSQDGLPELSELRRDGQAFILLCWLLIGSVSSQERASTAKQYLKALTVKGCLLVALQQLVPNVLHWRRTWLVPLKGPPHNVFLMYLLINYFFLLTTVSNGLFCH